MPQLKSAFHLGLNPELLKGLPASRARQGLPSGRVSQQHRYRVRQGPRITWWHQHACDAILHDFRYPSNAAGHHGATSSGGLHGHRWESFGAGGKNHEVGGSQQVWDVGAVPQEQDCRTQALGFCHQLPFQLPSSGHDESSPGEALQNPGHRSQKDIVALARAEHRRHDDEWVGMPDAEGFAEGRTLPPAQRWIEAFQLNPVGDDADPIGRD
jgi:hypothetical protein